MKASLPHFSRLISSGLVASLLAGSAMAAETTLKKVDGILVDAKGRTVYTFDKDEADSGKSSCYGPCATLWPPVTTDSSPAAPYSAINRDDGSKQLAYKGKPLYLYAADSKPGDRNGDGLNKVWHVVKD